MNISQIVPHISLNTPVLFLVFNRLDTTKVVFEEIKKAKPPRLYIGSDGPRENKLGETEKVLAVRDYILSNINWDCEVKTLLREKNLGCRIGVSQAITWFFENEEMGIILEDDCLPSQSFFLFCEELLNKYKDDERIGMISGRNNLGIYQNCNYSYSFTTGGGIWGWASWRRVVKDFNINHPIFKSKDLFQLIYNSIFDLEESLHITNVLLNLNINSWDYQWGAYLKINSMLSITPKYNMINNIGFSSEATHTTNDFNNIISYEIYFPLNHPEFINADIIFTKKLAKKYYNISTFNKYKSKINNFFKSLLKS